MAATARTEARARREESPLARQCNSDPGGDRRDPGQPSPNTTPGTGGRRRPRPPTPRRGARARTTSSPSPLPRHVPTTRSPASTTGRSMPPPGRTSRSRSAGTSAARVAQPSIAGSNAASSAHSGGAPRRGRAHRAGQLQRQSCPAQRKTRPRRQVAVVRRPVALQVAPRQRGQRLVVVHRLRGVAAHPAPVRRAHRQPLQRDPRHQHVHRPVAQVVVAALGQARQQLRALARALLDQPEQVVQHAARGAQMATLLQRPLHPRQEPRRAQRMQPITVLRRDQVQRAAHGPCAHQAGGGHVATGQARDAGAQRQPRRADVLGLDPAHRACRLRRRARGGRGRQALRRQAGTNEVHRLKLGCPPAAR